VAVGRAVPPPLRPWPALPFPLPPRNRPRPPLRPHSAPSPVLRPLRSLPPAPRDTAAPCPFLPPRARRPNCCGLTPAVLAARAKGLLAPRPASAEGARLAPSPSGPRLLGASHRAAHHPGTSPPLRRAPSVLSLAIGRRRPPRDTAAPPAIPPHGSRPPADTRRAAGIAARGSSSCPCGGHRLSSLYRIRNIGCLLVCVNTPGVARGRTPLPAASQWSRRPAAMRGAAGAIGRPRRWSQPLCSLWMAWST
jgi:hypothetical protein